MSCEPPLNSKHAKSQKPNHLQIKLHSQLEVREGIEARTHTHARYANLTGKFAGNDLECHITIDAPMLLEPVCSAHTHAHHR